MHKNCPTFDIDLDAPPETRWDHIIPHYKTQIPKAAGLAEEMLGSKNANVAENILNMATSWNALKMPGWDDEIRGICKSSGLSVGKVLLVQLIYEAFAACTSVIVNGKNHPIHIRTMDWDLPILKELTIQINFKRRDKTVFTGTTWVGYIGVLTGMKARAFSVSINYRQTRYGINSPIKGFMYNLYRFAMGHWAIGFLVRDVLDSDANYYKAVKKFTNAELISPTYITICGTRKNQGMIITRNRSPHDNNIGNVKTLLGVGDIVQANTDHWRTGDICSKDCVGEEWNNICESKYRQKFVLDALDKCENRDCLDTLWIIMATDPCYSDDITIYTSLMIPAQSNMVTEVNIPMRRKMKGEKIYSNIIKKCKKLYNADAN